MARGIFWQAQHVVVQHHQRSYEQFGMNSNKQAQTSHSGRYCHSDVDSDVVTYSGDVVTISLEDVDLILYSCEHFVLIIITEILALRPLLLLTFCTTSFLLCLQITPT